MNDTMSLFLGHLFSYSADFRPLHEVSCVDVRLKYDFLWLLGVGEKERGFKSQMTPLFPVRDQ